MKKVTGLVIALGLMASIAASASAADVTGTVTESTYTDTFTIPVITQADLRPATPQIILTRVTPFYFTQDGFPISLLEPQTLDTTGQVMTDALGKEWREIYTWMGKAWIMVPPSAYIILP
ncbi:hypothetical protein [Paenibacillus sp. sgz500958]|uniref:hypothetical protein n=1 Tax=Paenibacillus sp. sgz500958 TaxID=3242475 RepID=UPI0036D3501E